MASRRVSTKVTGVCALVACSFAALVAAVPVSAGTLDQSQSQGSDFFGFGDERLVGQTFTAGAGGPLDRVDLMVEVFPVCVPDADATIEIRTVSGGLPTSTVLARATLPAVEVFRSTSDFVPVVFPSPHNVVGGTQYAIVASAPGAGECQLGSDVMARRYLWRSESGNPYPAGTMVLSDDSGASWTRNADVDMAFRTYVVQARCGGKVATRVGTPGPDTLVGTPGNDVIAGLEGKDTIRGLGGKDKLCGLDGRDKLKGGAGKDKLKGAKGKDRLNGGGGRDKCVGGGGRDRVKKCEIERSV